MGINSRWTTANATSFVCTLSPYVVPVETNTQGLAWFLFTYLLAGSVVNRTTNSTSISFPNSILIPYRKQLKGLLYHKFFQNNFYIEDKKPQPENKTAQWQELLFTEMSQHKKTFISNYTVYHAVYLSEHHNTVFFIRNKETAVVTT